MESLDSIKTDGNEKSPDQAAIKNAMNQLMEQRTHQNQVKNKLIKALKSADQGKWFSVLSSLNSSYSHQINNCTDKQQVLSVPAFYAILKDEANIELKQIHQNKIKKQFVNIKDNTVPYAQVLKCLEYSAGSNEWVLRGNLKQISLPREVNSTLNKFCDTNLTMNIRPCTPEQNIQRLTSQFKTLAQRSPGTL